MNEYSIKTENLTKKFGTFTAVNSISFEVSKGEIFGFLGANGAGKSTAMKMLCGLLEPTSGIATIAGFDIYKDTENIKKKIGYMSQKFSLYDDLTVEENIKFFGGIYGLSRKIIRERTDELMNWLNIYDLRKTLVQSIPLGWKQKISFAVSVFHNPEIVFLDEPTGGVDPITRRQFWEMIYQKSSEGITIFVTTHYMDEAEYCNRISMMNDGEIEAIGTPKELKSRYSASNMDEVFLKIARGNQ